MKSVAAIDITALWKSPIEGVKKLHEVALENADSNLEDELEPYAKPESKPPHVIPFTACYRACKPAACSHKGNTPC